MALQHDSVPLTQEDYYFMHFLMFVVQPAVQKETLLLLLMCKKKKKKRERKRKGKKERKVMYSPASSPSCSNRGAICHCQKAAAPAL